MDIIELEGIANWLPWYTEPKSSTEDMCMVRTPPVPKETVLLIFDKQLYLDRNLNCEDVGATTCFNGS